MTLTLPDLTMLLSEPISTCVWNDDAPATARPVARTGRLPRADGTIASAQAWIEVFRAGVKPLRDLQAGWAGSGSRPVPERNFYLVEQYLGLALAPVPNPRLPSVVPAANGGLQIEWSREAIDLEVLFGPEGRVTAYVEDRELGVEFEEEGDAAVDLLLRWAPRVAQEDGHGRVAPAEVNEETQLLAA